MPDVLGPDDLGQLTLILHYTKCLNLNPIMPSVLGPGDLDEISTHSKFLYVSLNFSMSLEIPIRVYRTYCYTVTDKDTYSIYVLTHVLNLFG